MKTILSVITIAFLSAAVVSCTKSDLSGNTIQTPVNTDPYISATINRSIVQPTAMELGTPSSILRQGDVVTIFVPFATRNEAIVSTTLTITDDATGEIIETHNLSHSTDPSATDLTLPENLYNDGNYFFVTFAVGDAYVGKTVSLKTKLEGQNISSEDVIPAAFTVIAN
jgi:hypothetical protein